MLENFLPFHISMKSLSLVKKNSPHDICHTQSYKKMSTKEKGSEVGWGGR